MCDFELFPRKKIKLKARYFNTLEEIEAESPTAPDTFRRADLWKIFC